MSIAVIVPVWNGERFLSEAIASIRAQTLQPDKVLVVDDGSSDGTAAWLAEQPDLVVLSQPNRGTGAARNRAIKASETPLLAFLDADDIWHPEYLEHQRDALTRAPALEASFTAVEQFYEDGRPSEVIAGFSLSAMVLRRQAFDRIGLFEETPGVPEFATWFLRAAEAGLRHARMDELLSKRRIHADNKGRRAGTGREYVRALKASLDRRRTVES